jgi:hypothetical protein
MKNVFCNYLDEKIPTFLFIFNSQSTFTQWSPGNSISAPSKTVEDCVECVEKE